MPLTIIGVDTDDTLWHTDAMFRLTLRRFSKLPGDFADGDTLEAKLASIACENMTSCGSALKVLGQQDRRQPGRLRETNRAQNAHLAIRRHERKMPGFNSLPSTQRVLTTRAAICNVFDFQRHMISQPTLRVFRARATCVWNLAAAWVQSSTSRRIAPRPVNLTAPPLCYVC
jgi:hypothetical protein